MSSTFTPVYQKAMAVLTGQKFAEPDWQKFLAETCGAIRLLGPAGFDPAYAGGLDSIRTKIKGDSKHSNSVAIFFLGKRRIAQIRFVEEEGATPVGP